jgi:hypothetical protein
MASAIYPSFAQAAYGKLVDWVNDAMSIYLVDLADYTYNAAHTVLADLTVAAREEVVSAGARTLTAGVADCADTTWTAAAGDGIEAIAFVDTTYNCLCLFIDLGGTTLLNGGNIVATWDNGANKVAKLY